MDYPFEVVVRDVQQRLECSILPLEDKRPAKIITTWKQLRSRKPTEEQIQYWFAVRKLQGYGVILGDAARGLFVVDFDESELYEEFCNQQAEISHTYTVRTRRGYHLYLRADQPPQTYKFAGGDIKGEGSYVVGEGSKVGGYTYTKCLDVPIKKVTTAQISDIKQILEIKQTTEITQNHEETIIQTEPQIKRQLQVRYQQAIGEMGRNNALYHTARLANQQKVPKAIALQALTDEHARANPIAPHRNETIASRIQEAQKTIISAYRTTGELKQIKIVKGQIPNNIREKLMQTTDSTAPGRFLEALTKLEYKPRDKISKTEAYQIGKQFHISNRDIRKTLEQKVDGKRIYKQIQVTSHSHNLSPHVWETDSLNSKSKPSASRGRRINCYYEIPSIELLCQLFRVRAQSSDPLSVEDLSSAKAYRIALHRELIKRQSPEQSMRWHAERLNVSKRTVRRYNLELGVIRTPIIGYVPLTHANVDDPSHYGIPIGRSDFTPGKWLQHSDGKRYPALKGIAISLLPKATQLIACHQRPSRLQLPDIDQPIILHDVVWRRLDRPDQSDWGGKATDLPPINPLPKQYKPIISLIEHQKAKPFSQTVESVSIDDISNVHAREHHVSHQINYKLTLISGIGERRAERLYDADISTMTQLIAAGAQKVASIGWAGGYVSEHTTSCWIKEAEELLGLRDPDPKSDVDIALEKRRNASKKFYQYLKSYRIYLEKICVWEDNVFGTGIINTLDWNRELSWVQYQFEDNRDFGSYLPHEQERYRERIIKFISDYIARIDIFIAMETAKLDKLGFGTMKGWRSLRRRSLTQQRYFDKQDV